MAAAALQKTFLGQAVPSHHTSLAGSSLHSTSRYPAVVAVLRGDALSDARRQSRSSQQRPQDVLPSFHATSAQDLTLLNSSSGSAFDSFWDNVLSETERGGGADQESANEKAQAGSLPRSSIAKDDWRAVRRVVEFDSKKAKQLRKKLRETESFHDTFYHSHVAEMLANRID